MLYVPICQHSRKPASLTTGIVRVSSRTMLQPFNSPLRMKQPNTHLNALVVSKGNQSSPTKGTRGVTMIPDVPLEGKNIHKEMGTMIVKDYTSGEEYTPGVKNTPGVKMCSRIMTQKKRL